MLVCVPINTASSACLHLPYQQKIYVLDVFDIIELRASMYSNTNLFH